MPKKDFKSELKISTNKLEIIPVCIIIKTMLILCVGKKQFIILSVPPVGVVPLIMTTFIEEFLFRGYMQNKIERNFGSFTTIFISGLMFSLYYLGYPGFRTLGNILLLFAVGVGFASAYKLSGNNLIVAYFVKYQTRFE